MFCSSVQNPTHLRFQREGKAKAVQSSGRAELDELGPGTGDKCDFAGDF